MNKPFLLTAVVAALGVPALSHAGFTASTNSFAAANSSSILTLGNSLSTTTAGMLTEYSPDTAADPQITGGDINKYRFTLNATATSVVGGVATYTGSYQLYYDYAGGLNVSAGNASFAVAATSGRLSILDGMLTQTSGPTNPALPNFAAIYGNPNVAINGSFTQKALDPTKGTLQINFEKTGQPVPEPASMAALGVGAIGLLRRRRKA